jgi:topoisomerase-4 subunit A
MTESKFKGAGTDKIEALYEDWFLDYASYVILDRAVPYYEDGLKPVQRRILHAFWEKHDGRYHKIANIIGHTMQYHPHGDASIGDAIINLGQKDLLIDPQGNWGNPITGDRAAAARYIEGRLTKFAVDVLFNPETTHWLPSYDGRNKEPRNLPVKFPLLLAQGTEGIAVGLSTKILPHNFCELITACIAHLRGRSFQLFPDFPGGGIADCSDYNKGQRGGRVKVRAKIEKLDAKSLVIREIPFGTTTNSLIESIVNANSKGKIKIKKIDDNTAQETEIIIRLLPGIEPQVVIDALYAFTDCEVSIAPNCCVVIENKPVFTSVHDLLKRSAEHTRNLLEWELKNQQEALEIKWHLSSLEKIFIEKKVYLKIEEADSRDHMVELIEAGLKPYIKLLRRQISRDDILKLGEIPIRRISRYDVKKTNELLLELDKKLEEVRHHLANLTDYTVDYFKDLLKKYGEGRERKTRVDQFEAVSAVHVAVANQKLYADLKSGFIGTGLRKEEFLFDVSPYDEVIAFKRDCTFTVTKVSEKAFVGKDVVHVEKFDKADQRLIYNMIYQDGKDGKSYVKRFNVGGITRDKQYDLSKGESGSILHYLSSNPNGEAETVEIILKPRPRIKLNFEFDFGEVAIKGRGGQGNTLTKYPIRKVKLLSQGSSTLGAQELWYDPISGMVNSKEKGSPLGNFEGGDRLAVVRKTGACQFFDASDKLLLGTDVHYCGKLTDGICTLVYFDGDKLAYYIKRFDLSLVTSTTEFSLISESSDSRMLEFYGPGQTHIMLEFLGMQGKTHQREVLDLVEDYPVKSVKALGTRFMAKKITKIAKASVEVLNGKTSLSDALKNEKNIELDLFG